MKKIVFLTGTRADYGKIKSLLKTIEASRLFELHVFVTGMHMSKRHGETWREVIRDGYEHIHLDRSLGSSSKPSVAKPNETKMFRSVFPNSLKKSCFLP